MEKKTYYTAVGHFQRRTDGEGNTYPVVLVNQQEHTMDHQEMAVWTALNWRLLNFRQIERHYDKLARELKLTEYRTLENCLWRLESRGLVASGSGETDFDALYDLLNGLYIVPISTSLPLRLATFMKMLLLDGVPFATAKQIFQRDKPSGREAQVMALSRQALLSTAELIKCVELGVSDLSTGEKVMDALYNDEYTTSDNIGYAMRDSGSKIAVTMAVANLCMRKQIIFERV